MSELRTVPKLRKIKDCLIAIQEIDPQTAVTEWYIRQLCKNKAIIYYKSGNKSLVNLDSLLAYLNRSLDEVNDETKNKEINHGTTD